MAKTRNQLNVETAVRPLYAVAGATDLAVELARGYVAEAQGKVTDAQKKAQKRAQARVQRVQSVDLEPKALQAKAVELVSARVDELTKDAKARQAKLEAYAKDTVSDLNETYSELATRGEKLVTRIRKQESSQDLKVAVTSATSRAKAARTTATKSAAATKTAAKRTETTAEKAVAATRSSAKATGTTARKGATATKSSAKATGTTARKGATATKSSAKGAVTATRKAAVQAVEAVEDGTKKIG